MTAHDWKTIGWFVATPLFLWVFVALVAARYSEEKRFTKKLAAMATALIAGTDGRLSLSRLQAFMWTLLIYGAYAAAFYVHVPYAPDPTLTVERADTIVAHARLAANRSDSVKRAVNALSAEKSASVVAIAAALKDSTILRERLKAQHPTDPATAAAIATLSANITILAVKDTLARLDERSLIARTDTTAKAQERDFAALESAIHAWATLRWISIPAALLALAGLAIGTGVFSSLISNATDSSRNACVTALKFTPYNQLPAIYDGIGVARRPDWPCAEIGGRDLGSSGYVRFGSDYADVLYWATSGNGVVVQLPSSIGEKAVPVGQLPLPNPPSVTVDTANGKRVYGLEKKQAGLELGAALKSYDWLDLFRDDRNPSGLALTKFQMFGWTVVGIVLYIVTFTRLVLRPDAMYMAALPDVDTSLVTLMGISQAAYLVGKAVSTVNPALTPPVQASPTTTPAPTLAPVNPVLPLDTAAGVSPFSDTHPGLIPPSTP